MKMRERTLSRVYILTDIPNSFLTNRELDMLDQKTDFLSGKAVTLQELRSPFFLGILSASLSATSLMRVNTCRKQKNKNLHK